MSYEALIQIIDQVLQKTDISANEKCALIDEHIAAEKKTREEKVKEDEFTDTPRLENQDDIYYSGVGPTFGIDLEGKRYWKLHNPFMLHFYLQKAHEHLKFGDVVDDTARTEKIIRNVLKKEGLI